MNPLRHLHLARTAVLETTRNTEGRKRHQGFHSLRLFNAQFQIKTATEKLPSNLTRKRGEHDEKSGCRITGADLVAFGWLGGADCYISIEKVGI